MTREPDEVGVGAAIVWCDAVACDEAIRNEDWLAAVGLYSSDLLEGLPARGGDDHRGVRCSGAYPPARAERSAAVSLSSQFRDKCKVVHWRYSSPGDGNIPGDTALIITKDRPSGATS